MEYTDRLTVDQKFAKAMLNLKELRPFYSSVYEVMNKRESNSIDTMGVTSDELVFNPQFCDKVSFQEFIFIILHEIAHIALMHVSRCNGRDKYLWNVACDLYVNRLLTVEFGNYNNSIVMPKGAVYWDKIDIEKDAVENLYDELYSQAKQNGYLANSIESDDVVKKYKFKLTRFNSEYSFEVDVNYKADLVYTSSNSAEIESKSRKLLYDAQIRNQLLNGNSIGKDFGALERLSKDLLESKLDWRKLIRKHLIAYSQSDTSYAKPDKRMYWQKAIYPGAIPSKPDSVKGVKICIDTSGSISDNDIAEFIGHIVKLTKQFKVDADLIYWDAKVQSSGKIKDAKDIQKINITGGGGTDPACVFEEFDKNKEKPILTIMLTDGYFEQKNLEVPLWKKRYKNTIWIICDSGDSKFKPVFGKSAELKVGLKR